MTKARRAVHLHVWRRPVASKLRTGNVAGQGGRGVSGSARGRWSGSYGRPVQGVPYGAPSRDGPPDGSYRMPLGCVAKGW